MERPEGARATSGLARDFRVSVLAHRRSPSVCGQTCRAQSLLHRLHMNAPSQRQVFIQGLTLEGRTFRPSDWAERLAGAMSSFRPRGRGGIASFIGYSPYCFPQVVDGVKCVIVSEALRDLEPMAWDFVMNFAQDNQLRVIDACWLPNMPARERAEG